MATTTTSKNGKGATGTVVAPIELQRITFGEIEIPIIGITPLIQNKFSEKARNMMLAKQMGETRQKKPPKNPEADYLASLHPMPDGGYGHPATAFKSATVEAARFFDGLAMTDLKRCIFVVGEGEDQLVRINGKPTMREDTTRNETGVADIRYRGTYWPWSAVLTIRFNAVKLSAHAVVNLVDAGGQSSGIGEWRPGSKKANNGSYGQYRIQE